MKEVEVKLLGLDRAQLAQEILDRGGRFVRREVQTNYVLDSDQAPIGPRDYLRIRVVQEEGEVSRREFTFKRRLNSPKDGSPAKSRVNEEYTVNIDSEEALLDILDLLGYQVVAKGYKQRDRYEIGDFVVEFDEWDKDTLSYPYIEVEAPDEDRLDDFLEAFSIARDRVSTKSIDQLRREDGKLR